MPFSHVALLRGINVGGRNILPMPKLAEIFTNAGCADVKTHIQSGNVLFNADDDHAATLPERIAEQIANVHGVRTRIVVRNLEGMEQAVAANPFEEGDVYVIFPASAPDPERVALLDPNRSPPDTFAVIGSEIYLLLPNGAARTKLTIDYFESKLKTHATARNLRTTTTLRDLMRE